MISCAWFGRRHEINAEGSACRQAQWCQGHGPFCSLVSFKAAALWWRKAVLVISCRVHLAHGWWRVSFFFSSFYLCGKNSTFTIYNLFRLQSSCSMLALKELDLNCGGKRKGGFGNLNPLFMMFGKMCFFTSGKIILRKTESDSELCWFPRVKPLPHFHLVDTVYKGIVPSPLLSLSPFSLLYSILPYPPPLSFSFCFSRILKRDYLSISGNWNF